MSTLRVLLSGLVAFTPGIALAHTSHGELAGLTGVAAGSLHPLTGLDHVLAMIAVGMLGAQMGGRALWALPAAFLSVMLAGGVLGLAGLPLPAVELAILLSVLVLGALIALGRPLPAALALSVVALFAAFHGYAHGAEMPAQASGLLYGLGFAVATGCLHGAGIGLAQALGRGARPRALRYAGVTIVALGIGLALA